MTKPRAKTTPPLPERWYRGDQIPLSAIRRFARQPGTTPAAGGPQRLQPVELWDLVSAFGRLMRETMTQQTHDVVVDQTPLHVYMEAILAQLERETRLPFAALFAPPHTRGRLVGLFLGVLQLTKQRRVLAEQGEPFAEIWAALAPPSEPGAGETQEEGPRTASEVA